MPEVVSRRSLAHAVGADEHDHLPEVRVLAHHLVRLGALLERERAREHRQDLALRDQLVGAIRLVGVREVRADDRLLAHPEVAHVEREREAGRGAAGDDLAERAAHEHAREERRRADVLEHDVAVDAAGGLADRLAEALDLGEVGLAGGVGERVVAPVDDRVRAEAAAEVGLVLARDDGDRVRAVQPAELDRHRAEPAARAPHEHVVPGLERGLVDEHPVGREVDEAVGRRLRPGQVLRLRQQLLRLHEAVVGERAPVRLVGPDLLLRAGHRVEPVALRALAAALVAVHDDLVAGLPARHARPDRRDDAGGVGAADVEVVAGVAEDRHGLRRGRPRRCCSSRPPPSP